MPSERFFYRPVPPNYEAIGQGIGYGIEAGVGNYFDEKDRQYQREREKEMDTRAEVQWNTWLADRGGGTGHPPPQAGVSPLEFGQPGMARGEPSPFMQEVQRARVGGPGNILTRDIDPRTDLKARQEFLSPEMSPLYPKQGPTPVARAAAAPPIRQYRDVGTEEYPAYIEDIESRELRRGRLERQIANEEADRQARTEMLREMLQRQETASALEVLGVPEGQENAQAFMLGTGQATYGQLNPRTTGAGGGQVMTWSQADSFVGSLTEDAYDMETGEKVPGLQLTPGERLRVTEALTRGEPTGIPEIDDRRSGAQRNQDEWWDYMQGNWPAEQIAIPNTPGPVSTPRLPGEAPVTPFMQPGQPIVPRGAEGYFGPSTTFEEMVKPGPGMQATPPQGEVTMTDAQINEIVNALKEKGLPEEKWEAALRHADFTTPEINRILGR